MKLYSTRDRNFALASAQKSENRFKVQLVSGRRTPPFSALVAYANRLSQNPSYPDSIITKMGEMTLKLADETEFKAYFDQVSRFKFAFAKALERFANWLPEIIIDQYVDLFFNGGFVTERGQIFPFDQLTYDKLTAHDQVDKPVRKITSSGIIKRSGLDIWHNNILNVAQPGWIRMPNAEFSSITKGIGEHLAEHVLAPREVVELNRHPITVSPSASALSWVLVESGRRLAAQADLSLDTNNLKAIE